MSASALALVTLAACGSSSDSGSAGKSGDAHVAVSLVSGGNGDECKVDQDSVSAGPVTFDVTNKSASGITEVELLDGQRIVAEKENLAPGLPKVSFTTTLDGGDYEIYCPNATTDKMPFKVTGKAATDAGSSSQELTKGTEEYSNYVQNQVTGMVTGVEDLQKAVDSGDLAHAQKAYAVARPFYEKIESDVDGFVLPGHSATDNSGNLDYLIDMRASNLDPKVGWHGFHAVERDLFARQKVTAKTKKLAAELTDNVKELAKVAHGLSFRPEDLANGAAGLLEEVQGSKISGEEEAYSHIDLVDMANNVEGAQQAFLALQPGLAKIDPQLTKTITAQFSRVEKLLARYKDPQGLGGYERYTPQVRKADANALSQAVQSLQDPLSRVGEKVVRAG